MSSWSCPHFDEKTDACRRLKTDCVPGRPGCILPRDLEFAVPPDQRIRSNHDDDDNPPAAKHPETPCPGPGAGAGPGAESS